MENLQIFHVNVNCSNLERSLNFYKMIGFREVLNFDESPNALTNSRIDSKEAPPDPGTWSALGLPEESSFRGRLLILGDNPRATRLDLLEWTHPKAEGKPYPHLTHVGIARICFKVKDAWQAYEELKTKGVEPFSEPRESGLGGTQQLVFCCRDPDGTVLEFMEFKKR